MMSEIIANGVRLLCGCRARWLESPPRSGPRVYYANHTSHLDGLIIWSALPPVYRRQCRMVAAADYWQATRLRRWMARDVLPTVLIDRKQVSRRNNPLDAMLATLDAGEPLIIFPEGGRGSGEDLGQFQAGLWHLARKRPELPFNAVWLENLSRVLPKGEILPVPLMTAVTFGPSAQLQPGQTKSEFLEMLRENLSQLREVN